jgi:hypothetical protein
MGAAGTETTWFPVGRKSGQRSGRRAPLEVLSKVLATAAPALAVSYGVKESFQEVVGAIDQTDASAKYPGRTFGRARFRQRFRRPDTKVVAGLVQGRSEPASRLASEPSQILAHIHLTGQTAQLVVSLAEQVRAGIAESWMLCLARP